MNALIRHVAIARLVLVGSVVALSSQRTLGQSSIQYIEPPVGINNFSGVSCVSGDGTAFGASGTDAVSGQSVALRWRMATGYEVLAMPAGWTGGPSRMSSDGSVMVGAAGPPTSNSPQFIVWHAGGNYTTAVQPPPTFKVFGVDVSADGSIVFGAGIIGHQTSGHMFDISGNWRVVNNGPVEILYTFEPDYGQVAQRISCNAAGSLIAGTTSSAIQPAPTCAASTVPSLYGWTWNTAGGLQCLEYPYLMLSKSGSVVAGHSVNGGYPTLWKSLATGASGEVPMRAQLISGDGHRLVGWSAPGSPNHTVLGVPGTGCVQDLTTLALNRGVPLNGQTLLTADGLSYDGRVLFGNISPSATQRVYRLTLVGEVSADFNRDFQLTVQDIFDFIGAWFADDPRADFNGVNGFEVQDIFDFLNAWFAGC